MNLIEDANWKLSYYINEKDQIRSIAHPDQEFNFFISKNERVCEVQREAMNSQSLQDVAFLILATTNTK